MKNNGSRCIVYHGSEFKIEHPFLGGGKARNDYGPGFYCTDDKKLAGEWAVGDSHDGYINRYELDRAGLRILDLTREPYGVLHWLAVLVENRIMDMDGEIITAAREYLAANFKVPYREADIVIGYRADDNYFSFVRGFLGGPISLEKLGRMIRLGELGRQTVLISSRAYERIRFLDAEPALRDVYLAPRKAREARGRKGFADILHEPLCKTDLYMLDILRKEMKADDPRLQRVLP